MNKKFILLFFWILGMEYDVYANKTYDKLLLKENNFSLGYNSSEGKYYVFYYDRYYTRDDNSKEWVEFPITYNEFPNQVSFGRLNHIEKKGNNYFVQSGGGAVYIHSNDSIIRVDNSEEYKLQFGSYLYVKDDTIFNMGGYGYFNNYNKILYFDENRNNEWFLYETKNFIPDPSNTYLNYHDRVNNYIYYFGGLYKVKTKPTTKKDLQYNVLRFSTDDKSWETLGKIDLQFSNKTDFINNYHNSRTNRSFYFFDENFLYVLIYDDLYTFNLRENSFTVSDFKQDNINQVSPIIYNKNTKEVMYITKYTLDEYPEISIKKLDEFLPKSYKEKHFIYSTSNSGWNYTIIFLTLVILTSIYYRQKIEALFINKNLILEDEKILYNGKQILIFDENEEKTLKYILKKTNKDGVGTDNLFDIIENGSQSFDNKRKKLSIILNGINTKLKAITNIPEDMIQSIPSKEDNRLRNYRLNKKLFEKD